MCVLSLSGEQCRVAYSIPCARHSPSIQLLVEDNNISFNVHITIEFKFFACFYSSSVPIAKQSRFITRSIQASACTLILLACLKVVQSKLTSP